MNPVSVSRNTYFIMAGIVLLVSVFLILTTENPGYTDAYYYFNAGKSLASGDGLTDHYLWNYVNAPDAIPTESHRYWMPLASVVAAIPMVIFGTSFDAAQIVYVPFLIGLVWLSMWLAARVSGKKRHIWAAGLMMLFGGFYFPFWLTTDTFAVYGLFGAGCLVALGLGREQGESRWFAVAGALAGLAHLARADGLLFLIVGLIVIWIPNFRRVNSAHQHENVKEDYGANGSLPLFTGLGIGVKTTASIALIAAYIIVMLPWFVRNMDVLGSPLPSGGIGTIFLHEYNDLFNYPAEWSLDYFLDWGWGNIIN
ncbi:MAG TPA: hypothetical protein VJZ27_10745 [Aggregatilineales bacterium]|nr:hypothetical protein [Aggregatilineales bacterium]